MEQFIEIVIYALIIVSFILLVQIKNKLKEKTEPYIEKTVEEHLLLLLSQECPMEIKRGVYKMYEQNLIAAHMENQEAYREKAKSYLSIY